MTEEEKLEEAAARSEADAQYKLADSAVHAGKYTGTV